MKTIATQRAALAAVITLTTAATNANAAGSDDANLADLQRQVTHLQAEVARLRANDDAHWLTQQRQDEIRQLVHDVLADADMRASLLGSGMTAGHDGSFFLASADGNFRLNVGGRLQIRYTYNYQSQGDAADDDRHRSGFENRRTRLNFTGHVINPNWTYQIQGDFSRSNGSFSLLDANVAYNFANGMRMRIGQFKPAFLREANTSGARQQAVERSLVNAQFEQGRTQGIELSGPITDNINFAVTFSDGFSRNNTAWNAETTEYAITGKLDFLIAGNWRQFRDFASWSNDEFGMLIGVAAHYERGEYGTPAASTERFSATADAMLEFGGANLFGAVVMNHLDIDGSGNNTQWGVVLQGGYFVVPDKWEIFGRYEWGNLDSPGTDDLSVLTAGVNHYIAGHNLKWQTDLGYAFNTISSHWASSSAGYRVDKPNDDGQLVFRTQLQLNF